MTPVVIYSHNISKCTLTNFCLPFFGNDRITLTAALNLSSIDIVIVGIVTFTITWNKSLISRRIVEINKFTINHRFLTMNEM